MQLLNLIQNHQIQYETKVSENMCFIGPTKNNERLNSIWRAKPTKCLGFSANNPFEIENELEADVMI